MTWADTAAVRSTIQGVSSLADKTFLSIVPTATPQIEPPYVIVHASDGVDSAERFTGPPVTENPEFTLHIVGTSAESVQAVTALVKARFVVAGFLIPPAVEGRRGCAGYWRVPVPIQVNDTIVPNLVYQVVELGWRSDPA